MAFLTPLFLAALAGLAIPVLLHLIQKERKNVVHFPSLMFLRRIPYQSVQRRRIRHWFLLMMRLAALALIVLAFARPFFRRQDLGAAASSGAREVVILLDRSYSMGYGDRWQRALSAAGDAVNGVRGQDRGSIVLFGSGAEVALRSTADRSRLQTALAGVESSASTTRYGPALKLAGSILGESALPRKEVILISDFQRSGWQGAEGVRLPDGAALTPVNISDTDPANMSVTPVALQRSMFENQERVTITAGVANHSNAASSVDLALDLGGRVIQTQRVSPAANGSASVTFEPVTVAEKNIRATVKLADDKLMRDNAFHFVLSPEPPVRIIIAERSAAARDTSLYLARALAVGEAPRFETSTRSADAMTAEDLNAASVVILNDVTPSQAAGERLQRFVERGGGLLVVLGERGSWPQSGELLPGVPGEPVDRSTGVPARLGALEYGHPVFEIFRAPRTGDFSAARFYGYRAVAPAAGAQVIARFDDGGAAMLERKVGNGRVLMFTSTVDLFWNDMALKPVYLPFLHRAVRHLAGYREPQPWRSVGEVVEPSSYTVGRTATELPRVVLTPKGERVTLDEEGPDVLELTEQGFYEVRPLNKEKDSGTAVVVASNVDLRESDLTAMDPQEVVAAALGHAGRVAAGEPEAVPTDQAQEGAQRIWWYLLFAGLLLLGAETVVANRSTV